MHKRNMAMTALLLAAMVALAYYLVPDLKQVEIFKIFNMPAFFVTMALSGGVDSPGVGPIIAGFLSFTLFYWTLALVFYVILLEAYLLRKIMDDLLTARHHLVHNPEKDSMDTALESLGHAVSHFEESRRRHLLLKDSDALDLTTEHKKLGSMALNELADDRSVKMVVKRFRRELTLVGGSERATAMLDALAKRRRSGRGTTAGAGRVKISKVKR
jgi:hypothetical protein